MLNNQMTISEWQVMRVIWAESGMTSAEIVKRLSHKDWKPNTVRSLLNRLVQKKYVTIQEDGRKYRYFQSIPEEIHIEHEIDIIADNICNKDKVNLLSYQIEKYELSIDNINYLINLLEDKKNTAPIEVNCKCPEGQCKCQHN